MGRALALVALLTLAACGGGSGPSGGSHQDGALGDERGDAGPSGLTDAGEVGEELPRDADVEAPELGPDAAELPQRTPFDVVAPTRWEPALIDDTVLVWVDPVGLWRMEGPAASVPDIPVVAWSEEIPTSPVALSAAEGGGGRVLVALATAPADPGSSLPGCALRSYRLDGSVAWALDLGDRACGQPALGPGAIAVPTLRAGGAAFLELRAPGTGALLDEAEVQAADATQLPTAPALAVPEEGALENGGSHWLVGQGGALHQVAFGAGAPTVDSVALPATPSGVFVIGQGLVGVSAWSELATATPGTLGDRIFRVRVSSADGPSVAGSPIETQEMLARPVAALDCDALANGGSHWWCGAGIIVAGGLEWLAAWAADSGAPLFDAAEVEPNYAVTGLALGGNGRIFNGGSHWFDPEGGWKVEARDEAGAVVGEPVASGESSGVALVSSPVIGCAGDVALTVAAAGSVDAEARPAWGAAVAAGHPVGAWSRGLGDEGNRGAPAGATCEAQPLLGGARAVGAGVTHSCAVTGEGTVGCWGLGDEGQLGDGASASSVSPVLVAGMTDAVEVALGLAHTCARRGDGTVACWGDGSVGQLGVPEEASATPVEVPLADVVALEAGTQHTCAVRGDGTVWCWGANGAQQLGVPGAAYLFEPQQVPGVEAAVRVALGTWLSCALDGLARVTCWGAGSPPTLIEGAGPVLDLAGFSARLCGLRVGGEVVCWSGLFNGASEVSAVLTLEGLVDIEVGLQQACGRSESEVWCWGDLAAPDKGPDTNPWPDATPTLVDMAVPSAMSVGAAHACALGGEGGLTCWGSRSEGQLGDGTIARALAPVAAADLASVDELEAGSDHLCARVGGEVRCWGRSVQGEAGAAGGVVPGPAKIEGLAGVSDLSLGGRHSCALDEAGVSCWGLRTDVEPGPEPAWSEVPLPIVGLPADVDALGSSAGAVCAVSQGVPWCWGALTSAGFEAEPSAVTLPGVVVEVDGGLEHMCARTAEGGVWCWGANTVGQLDGTTTASPAPVQVAGLPPAVAIAAMEYTSCAIDAAGVARCWGAIEPWLGKLEAASPTVIGTAPVASLAGGPAYRCLLLGEGGVECEGYNAQGQLGQGTLGLLNVAVPAAPVVGLEGGTAIVATRHAACARTDEGVWCWGDHTYGQLGHGLEPVTVMPVPVLPF